MLMEAHISAAFLSKKSSIVINRVVSTNAEVNAVGVFGTLAQASLQYMAREKGSRLFALSVDHDPALLLSVRQWFDPHYMQFDQAFSVGQAREFVSGRFYCFLLIRYETAPEDEILRFCSCFRSRNPRALVMVFADVLDAALEERLFDHGANDVVNVRQSSPPALAKRIRSHLQTTGVLQPCPARVRLGDALVDFDRREVLRERTVHRLPGILADLLRYLIENADHIITREELQQSPIWLDSICTPATQGGKTFDVNIGKLRKIIEPDPHQPRIIVSVRGVGWKLAPELLRDESDSPEPE
jgi:two-component system response regulator RegX3